MAEIEPNEIRTLSDSELLDRVEAWLRHSGPVDFPLGCDPAARIFYAGSQTGQSLREVLLTLLRDQASSCGGSRDTPCQRKSSSHEERR